MKFWIFQAVPERYNISDKMKSLPNERWFVTRYFSEIKGKDVVYFWQAGKAAGLYGWGFVKSPEPYLTPEGDYRAEVSYEVRFDSPITKEKIRQDNRFKELQILQAPQGTNFRVKAEEAIALNELIKRTGFATPPDPEQPGEENSQ